MPLLLREARNREDGRGRRDGGAGRFCRNGAGPSAQAVTRRGDPHMSALGIVLAQLKVGAGLARHPDSAGGGRWMVSLFIQCMAPECMVRVCMICTRPFENVLVHECPIGTRIARRLVGA